MKTLSRDQYNRLVNLMASNKVLLAAYQQSQKKWFFGGVTVATVDRSLLAVMASL